MLSSQALKGLIQSADFWRKLNPELSINNKLLVLSDSGLGLLQEEIQELINNLKAEGYFQLDPILPPHNTARLRLAVERIWRAKLPTVFAFVYDEFWELAYSLHPIVSAVLGRGYRQLPDLWVWYVEPSNSAHGWGRHRDKNHNTILPDGMPESFSVWIPLSDTTPLNGCMYVVPSIYDPNYPHNLGSYEILNVQGIRALPAKAGSVLGWNENLLHWGGHSSQRANQPRISVGCEFIRGDIKPYNKPIVDPAAPPGFEQRLGLIGKSILQYKQMYALPDQLAEVASALKKYSVR
jgi:hypothetical protein